MSLQGKVALVTGGGKNLGAQSARELAREGANLALHYNSPKSKDETLRFRDELKGQYNALQVSIHAGDLTTASAVEQLFKDVLAEHRKIDIVVSLALNGLLSNILTCDRSTRWGWSSRNLSPRSQKQNMTRCLRMRCLLISSGASGLTYYEQSQ